MNKQSMRTLLLSLMILFSGCSHKTTSEYDRIIADNISLYSTKEDAESSDIGAIIQNFNMILHETEPDDFLIIVELEQCYAFFIVSNPISDWYEVIPSEQEIIVFDSLFDDYIEYDIKSNNDPSGFRYRFTEISKKFLHRISEIEYDKHNKTTN